MDYPLSEEKLSAIFKTSNKHPDRLIKREDTNHEFKESYNNANMAIYFKTIAAFANNEGGYIVFGIKDTPHILLGLNEKSLKQFENIKVELFTNNLNEYFTQTIKWENGIFEFKGLSFGVIYVYPLLTKPAICKKNYDCEDKKYSLKDSDIYFRYAGRSERIKSSDLEKIIDERRKNEEKQWLNFIEKAAKIGIQNASIINLDNGEINEPKGKIVIDKELIKQIKFIKEGEFSEKNGAPTLRLIGNIQEIETGRLVLTEPKKIIKAIEHSDIIESFLKQEDISSPEDYIKHICSGFSGKYPVYYYIYKAKISISQALQIVETSTSRYSGKKGLLKRLKGEIIHQQTVKKADTELSKLKLKYIVLWENHSINPTEKELRGCISAIMYLSANIIQNNKEYILDTIQQLFNKYYENANGLLAADFRNSITYLDETLYIEKCTKE